MSTCAQCGSPLPEGARFCGQCGAVSVRGPNVPEPPYRSAPAPAPNDDAPGHGQAGDGQVADAQARARLASQTVIQFAGTPAPQVGPEIVNQVVPQAPVFPSSSGSEPTDGPMNGPANIHRPLEDAQPGGPAQGDTLATTQVSPGASALIGSAGALASTEPQAVATSAKKTMIGIPMSDIASSGLPRMDGNATAAPLPPVPPAYAPAQPLQSAAPAEANAQNLRVSASKTMLGVAMPGIAPTANAMPAPAMAGPAQPSLSQPATAPESPAARSKTMLGVAIPGIAPLRDPDPNAPAVNAQNQGAQSMNRGGTMMGVAVPGIAPMNPGMTPNPPYAQQAHAQYGQGAQGMAPAPNVRGKLANTSLSQAPILPMPPPFVEDDAPAPSAPRKRATRGVPIGVVAAIIGGIVLVGGGIIAALYRGTPPIAAQPKLDAQGNEQLHLRCDNCKDGTIVELDGAKTTFHAGDADLPLTKSLEVGENLITLHVDRPGVGRDETVKLVVPVAFRIRADLANIGARPPVITVRVAAAPATDVTVDGKALALDPSGKGAYALDVSAETEGLTDELRVIDRKIPYTVTLKGAKAESGVVSARVAVVPIRLDGPSSHAVIDQPSFVLAGQTSIGAAITLNDKPVTVNADGTFAQSFDAKTLGEIPIEIRATAPSRAPRTAHVTVKHVASLDAEAKAAEAQGPLTYDAINADIASKIGQRAVIAGEVVEARVVGHQMIALVDDRRGCANRSAQCLARVVTGEQAKVAKGDMVRAYGRVTRAVTATNGKVVPEIEGDFVVKGRAPR